MTPHQIAAVAYLARGKRFRIVWFKIGLTDGYSIIILFGLIKRADLGE